jgi:hypothetical protein
MTPLLGGLIAAGLEIINKVIPDPQAKAAAQLELLRLQQAGEFKQLDADLQVMLAQSRINEVEAGSADSFKGSWRPAVGWVCVTSLAYNYIAQPLCAWYSLAHALPVPPTLDVYDLVILLGGMLGFGGMRMFEKIRGKA